MITPRWTIPIFFRRALPASKASLHDRTAGKLFVIRAVLAICIVYNVLDICAVRTDRSIFAIRNIYNNDANHFVHVVC